MVDKFLVKFMLVHGTLVIKALEDITFKFVKYVLLSKFKKIKYEDKNLKPRFLIFLTCFIIYVAFKIVI